MEAIIKEISATSASTLQDIRSKFDEWRRTSHIIVWNEWQCELLFNMILHGNHDKELLIELPKLSLELFKLLMKSLLSVRERKRSIKIKFVTPLTKEEAELFFEMLRNKVTSYTIGLNDTIISIEEDSSPLRMLTLHQILDRDTTPVLMEHIASHGSIEGLTVNEGTYSANGRLQLVDAIRKNKSIQRFVSNLESSRYLAKSVIEAFSTSKTLISLALSYLPTSIVDLLAASTSLKSLYISTSYATCYRKEDLVTIESINSLAEGLKKNTTLTHLLLPVARINDEMLGILATAWVYNTNMRMRELNLEGNKFTIGGFIDFLKVLDNAPRLTLQTNRKDGFDLYNDAASEMFIVQWIQRHQSIEQIDCKYKREYFSEISEALEANKNKNNELKHIMKLLHIAQTLRHSNFTSLIQEESLVPIILYSCQQKIDDKNSIFFTQQEVNRIWQYSKLNETDSKKLFNFVKNK